jgi:hypothetical protein
MKAALVVVTGVLALTAPAARAYTCTRAGEDGPSVAWFERSIVMQPSGAGVEVSDPARVAAVLQASMEPWNDVACSDVELLLGEETDDRLAGFDWAAGRTSPANHNIVVFRADTPGDPVDEWLHELGALAITTVTFESNQGRLLDADIEVNDVNPTFRFTTCDPGSASCAVDFDLQNTLTHELGHVLGLDHSQDADATMFATASRGDVSKRSLSPDDVEAICTIYPQEEALGECYGVPRESPPDVRFTPTVCGAGPAAAPLWLTLLFLRSARRRPEGSTTRRHPR